MAEDQRWMDFHKYGVKNATTPAMRERHAELIREEEASRKAAAKQAKKGGKR